ncbi:ParA family protein [Haladaptatus salinisoli]|uniref:ParA family protein n=1 Tax=Haladaptatus salinisoli TaxID=2884876 RepID=UPI001D09ECEE|nr:ParA family protein [Haladaptatus salinisoli]
MAESNSRNSTDRINSSNSPYESIDTSGTSRAVSVCMLKGGVGKSTIAVNLARQLATHDHDVLLIDLDPNGHASVGLGFDDHYHDTDESIGDVFFDDADPVSVIYDTDHEFDILPSSENLEQVEREIVVGDIFQPSALLQREVVDPLLGDKYDYIVTDSPAYRSRLTDNALVATSNLVLPLAPGNEAMSGLERTIERQIAPLRKHMDVDVLALVPNMLNGRIDQQTQDRQLLERLNSHASLQDRIPNFARITDWEAVDAGDSKPTPGIRDRTSITKAYGERQPLLDYDPECDQLTCFDELAHIVEAGEVIRNE